MNGLARDLPCDLSDFKEEPGKDESALYFIRNEKKKLWMVPSCKKLLYSNNGL